MYRPASTQVQHLPVIVELSGCCISGAAYEANRANFREVAGPAILVYPTDVNGNWNAGACCGAAPAAGINDVGYVTQVIAMVKAEEPGASGGSVYLAGYSNGGKLAMVLACDEPSLFAAVAVYGATRTSTCAQTQPESVLLMAGTADPEDSVAGPPVVQNGFTQPTVNELSQTYLSSDQCADHMTSTTAGNLQERVWSQCTTGRLVGIALWSGQGHAWPETQGPTPSAQQVMWDWFVSLGAGH